MKMTTLFYSKMLACALAATCALGAAADAGAQTLGDLIKKGKLTIGVVQRHAAVWQHRRQGRARRL